MFAAADLLQRRRNGQLDLNVFAGKVAPLKDINEGLEVKFDAWFVFANL